MGWREGECKRYWRDREKRKEGVYVSVSGPDNNIIVVWDATRGQCSRERNIRYTNTT